MHKTRKVRVLINPRSGVLPSFDAIRKAVAEFWEKRGDEVMYQFCSGIEDGVEKARRAVADGVDAVLVAGGDGTVNSVGRSLIGSEVALGVIPTGSGNGFARHFEIPLGIRMAVRALAEAESRHIDVGVAAGTHPFIVTCSMAWDASIVRSFQKSALRGIVPYIFAGLNEFFMYKPQKMTVQIDSREELELPDPIVFTVANLTQYGAGVKIAPRAKEDDGYLELVVVLGRDIPRLLPAIPRLISGAIHEAPGLITRRFKRLVVRRSRAAPIQIDGDLVETSGDVEIVVRPRVLRVLAPG